MLTAPSRVVAVPMIARFPEPDFTSDLMLPPVLVLLMLPSIRVLPLLWNVSVLSAVVSVLFQTSPVKVTRPAAAFVKVVLPAPPTPTV